MYQRGKREENAASEMIKKKKTSKEQDTVATLTYFGKGKTL